MKASIDTAYCDCGSKNEEIVSQVWAEMVIGSSVTLLVDLSAIVAAAALAIAARAFGGRGMPVGWAWLSYLTAALLVASVLIGFAEVGDVADWLSLVTIGILVPIWAVWLGLRFREDSAARLAT